ncbi:hypothetical protein DMB66_47420 [Actinoplanes sp. ATCC 53533]|uniref:DNA-processing protein DprA n=1 Tax=Actinoplanes sp. ATCC 53533 TaxID=1288362 RepID=UPI000F770B9C|nr:DNA-processing protein DprA [Actinoplanes sp. ATCC 53533]RSM47769.1 hypothetical protein DMB66_47420 [Actinoplanes sp. ATCC 53533]
MYLDHQARDARAGLSLFAGRSLPSRLFDVAGSLGLSVGGWAYRSVIAAPDEHGEWNIERLCRRGRTVQETAYASRISMLVPGDPGWPAGTGCDDLPCLWVRGNVDVAGLLGTAVAVTGTDGPSDDGRTLAAGLVTDLAHTGWTIATSTDGGIDQHVTATVLDLPDAVPLLVTGGGLDPASSPAIAAILPPVLARGAVISMAPPGARPWRARVRARNELLHRLGAASVLVEAGARSRHLRAARGAARSGRLVCAVPGPAAAATSQGCRKLLREGVAHPVTDAQQVLDAIGSRGIQLSTLPRMAHTGPDRDARALDAFPAAATEAIDVVLEPPERPTRRERSVSDPAGGRDDIADTLAA